MSQVSRAARVRLPAVSHDWRLSGQYLGDTVPRAALVAATVAAVVTMAYLGKLREALVAVVVLLLVPVFVKRPLLLLFAYLLASTNLLETIQLRYMTALQVGPVIPRVSDALIILMLVVAVIRLRKRRQRPMFLAFVILWGAYVAFQLVYGHFLLGEFGMRDALVMPLNRAGDLVGWVLYLLLVALIDAPRDLRIFGWFFLAIMAVAVVYQVAEFAHGGRIVPFHVTVPVGTTYFDYTKMLDAGGVVRPYLWSRASQVTIVGFFLALSAVMSGRRFLVYGPLAAAGLLSVAMTQIRGMYFGVAIGVLAVVGLLGWRARRLARVLALLGLLVAMAAVLTPFVASSFGGDPTEVLWARASTLSHYSTDTNWTIRVNDAKRAWGGLEESPFVGFGWGGTSGTLSGESGMNVVVVHGVLGTLMILAMYLTVLVKAIRLALRLTPSLERSWLFGLVGVLVAELAMTPSTDSLVSGGFAVVAAVFVDRISAFKADGLLAESSAARQNGGDI